MTADFPVPGPRPTPGSSLPDEEELLSPLADLDEAELSELPERFGRVLESLTEALGDDA